MSMDLMANVLIEAGMYASLCSHILLHFILTTAWLPTCLRPSSSYHTIAGDNLPALSTACKSLSVSVQLRGLDTQDTLQHHSQIAALLVDTGESHEAILSCDTEIMTL